VRPGEARAQYLEAIRAADKGEMQTLIAFARS
jgi:cellobiose-specific phosphotransferase system component IIA